MISGINMDNNTHNITNITISTITTITTTTAGKHWIYGMISGMAWGIGHGISASGIGLRSDFAVSSSMNKSLMSVTA